MGRNGLKRTGHKIETVLLTAYCMFVACSEIPYKMLPRTSTSFVILVKLIHNHSVKKIMKELLLSVYPTASKCEYSGKI